MRRDDVCTDDSDEENNTLQGACRRLAIVVAVPNDFPKWQYFDVCYFTWSRLLAVESYMNSSLWFKFIEWRLYDTSRSNPAADENPIRPCHFPSSITD